MDSQNDLHDVPLDDLLERARKLALAEDPEAAHDGRWEVVDAIRNDRADEAGFNAALAWSSHLEPRLRALGRDVLGQFATATDAAAGFAERSVPLLLEALDDPDSTALGCAVVALHHLRQWHAWDVAPIAALAACSEASLRFDVAYTLGGAAAEGSAPAVEALLSMMEDADEEVRDWATFGVAQAYVDDERIREALFARTTDTHVETRLEAIVGLARRRDPRAFALIEPLLDDEAPFRLATVAAEELADPRLVPLLEGLVERFPDDEEARGVLDSCRRGPDGGDEAS